MESMSEIQLERFKFCVFSWITQDLIKDFSISPELDISLHSNFMSNEIVFRIRQDVLGQQLDKVEVRYPWDWWQAFKQRWFPQWLLKRYPVVEMVKVIDIRALYPKITIPDHKPVINVWQHEYRFPVDDD